MAKIVNYSRNILQREYEVNNLISNLLIYIFNLSDHIKNGETVTMTDTERNIINYLHSLTREQLKGLINLINIINSGAYKYLNKYFIIDFSIPESLKSDRNNIVCDFKILKDPSVFRKICKKLYKEKSYLINLNKDSEIVDIKEVFNENIHNLNFILNEIVLDLQPDNFDKDVETCQDTLDTVLNKLKSNIINRFSNSL